MSKTDDFFFSKNTVVDISEKARVQLLDYLAPIEAFSRTTSKSIYVIDYEKKGFDYVSDNPLFLCGKTPDEVKSMGYEFYFKFVTKTDIELLLKINKIGFDFYDDIPTEEKTDYTISYDFHLKNTEDKVILINQKLTPLFITEDGKIWKAICIVSLSSSNKSGNIKIFKKNSNTFFKFNESGNHWTSSEEIELTDREKEILRFSSRGFTINEIANEIFLSPDTIKFHRKKIFEKLEVSNISEAIALTAHKGLI